MCPLLSFSLSLSHSLPSLSPSMILPLLPAVIDTRNVCLSVIAAAKESEKSRQRKVRERWKAEKEEGQREVDERRHSGKNYSIVCCIYIEDLPSCARESFQPAAVAHLQLLMGHGQDPRRTPRRPPRRGRGRVSPHLWQA